MKFLLEAWLVEYERDIKAKNIRAPRKKSRKDGWRGVMEKRKIMFESKIQMRH